MACGPPRCATCNGSRSSYPRAACMFTASRTGLPACTQSAVTRCGRCASYAAITPETPTYSFPSAADLSAPSVSTASFSASARPPRCHSRSTHTCFAMPAGLSWPTMATTRRPCSTTSATRTFSTPSGTPKWRPTDSRIFGGTESERPLHHAFVGLAGAGKLGTTSASPSITCAVSPARAANIALIAAMASSICSSLICLIVPECSIRMSLGTKSTSNFKKTAGCCFITLSIAARPPRRKAACISRVVSVAHEVCAVRRAEKKAAATIKRDVREAFGERPRADELERAGTWIDAVAERLVRLGAHRGDEKALVRAYGHWHDDLFRLEARSRVQRTVRLQRMHPDIAVLGVGDVDECGRERGDTRDHGQQDRNDGYLHLGSSSGVFEFYCKLLSISSQLCRELTRSPRLGRCPDYSITSSARASSVGGTSRPSAFAVVRLTTSSNLVGCSTGRSAGFAPRRILST